LSDNGITVAWTRDNVDGFAALKQSEYRRPHRYWLAADVRAEVHKEVGRPGQDAGSHHHRARRVQDVIAGSISARRLPRKAVRVAGAARAHASGDAARQRSGILAFDAE
jgi:hypothetical protein